MHVHARLSFVWNHSARYRVHLKQGANNKTTAGEKMCVSFLCFSAIVDSSLVP